MGDFIAALGDPHLTFLRYALIAGLLASVACGVVGTYVVTRRITSIVGAISHCVLGGIGAAVYARGALGWAWMDPMFGALAAALLAAVIIGLISLRARQREDTLISALWAVGMATGLLFFWRTPGYAADPMSYLFGNILLLSHQDLWLTAGLDAIVVFFGVVFFNKIVAVCFDEEFARVRGISVEKYYLLLLCLTALTVVLMVRLVGLVLVIALLTLPAATAGHFSRKMWHMMIWAVLLCALFTTSGLALSYHADLPSGPVVVFIGAASYLAVMAALFVRRKILPKSDAP